MLTDSTGLVIALLGASLATRAATTRRTFGLQRAEVLAALANALLLVGVSVWVVIQAVERFREPETIDTTLMLGGGRPGLGRQPRRLVDLAPGSVRESQRPRGVPGGAG